MHRLIVPSVAAVLVAAAALANPACSNQSEGERCDQQDDNRGADDCQNGLVCTAKSELPTNPTTDICCPSNRAEATTSVCALQAAPPNTDAAPPPEGGEPTEAGEDAPSDGSSDAPSDGAPDAPADAPTDAGAG